MATELGVDFVASDAVAAEHPRLRPPRIAVYAGHVPMMDEGWTRWLLDRYELPSRTLGNDDIGNGLVGEYRRADPP